MIHVFVITLIIVSMATQLIRYALSTLTTYYIISLMKRLNSIIFERIIKQNLSYFDLRTKRDLRYLLTSDMKHISISLHNNVIIIESGVHFLSGIIYIFVINWDIGVIIIASFIVLLMISLFYIKKYNIIYELYKKSFTHVIASVEMLNYITTIKTFAKEDDESFIYNVCIDRAFHNLNNKTSLTNGYRFWMGIMISFTILAIVWYGSFIIMNDDANNNNNNTLTLGFLIVDLFILLHINFCIYQIVHLLPAIILKCSKSLNRILDVYDLSSSIEVGNNNNNNKTENYIPVECKICGQIGIKNISFMRKYQQKQYNVHIEWSNTIINKQCEHTEKMAATTSVYYSEI